MTLVPFTAAHVLPAAGLVVEGVARLRRRVPALPAAWESPVTVAKALAGLAERGTGLVAVDDDEVVAFQLSLALDGRGGRWSFTPDIAHAAPPDPAARLRSRLYADLADGWVRSACAEHVVAVLADDLATLDAYARLGFGWYVVDLVADLRPIAAAALPDGVSIRRGGPADAPALMDLDAALRRHLEASPVFLRLAGQPALEVHRRRLEDPATATFLAEREGAPVAFLRIGPSATDVAMIVRDPGTASVTGAYTRPDVRGLDVGSHLLGAAVDWAAAEGYARWAVDHESANLEATRFWLRHATPVIISMSRRMAPGTVT